MLVGGKAIVGGLIFCEAVYCKEKLHRLQEGLILKKHRSLSGVGRGVWVVLYTRGVISRRNYI